MARRKNRPVLRGKDVVADAFQALAVTRFNSAGRPGENRIADDGERAIKTVNQVGRPSRRMTGGIARLDVQFPQRERHAWLER